LPRSLNFAFDGRTFALALTKVDRAKLYGEIAIESFDDNGRLCELVSLARDGRTMVAMGGSASGYLTEDGLWADRDELTAIDAKGNVLEIASSTFDLTTQLVREATLEDYLDHEIRLPYLLSPADGQFDPGFLAAIQQGKIFQIDFSYRGGSFTDPAFILAGDEDMVWLMVGEPARVEYVGLSQAAVCAATATAELETDDSDDTFDFNMM
jgi:hypothetical protein